MTLRAELDWLDKMFQDGHITQPDVQSSSRRDPETGNTTVVVRVVFDIPAEIINSMGEHQLSLPFSPGGTHHAD